MARTAGIAAICAAFIPASLGLELTHPGHLRFVTDDAGGRQLAGGGGSSNDDGGSSGYCATDGSDATYTETVDTSKLGMVTDPSTPRRPSWIIDIRQ